MGRKRIVHEARNQLRLRPFHGHLGNRWILDFFALCLGVHFAFRLERNGYHGRIAGRFRERIGQLGSVRLSGARRKGKRRDPLDRALSAIHRDAGNRISQGTADISAVARYRAGRSGGRDVVLRAGDNARPATGAGSLRLVTVGIIGAGNELWAYLQVLDRLVPRGLARLGPVCARRRENWAQLQSRRPGIDLVAEPIEVLRGDVDVVLIITSPESHSGLAKQSLEHGKHVVVEKPAASTRCEAQQLAQLAQECGLHLMCAPFVQLAPTVRALWGRLQDGAIGKVHSARALYGNAGSTWANWYHDGTISPLAEVGIYNLKSLTAILGPVVEVQAAEALVQAQREIAGDSVATAGADVSHVILKHQNGALSSLVSSHCIQRYRRPALEFYGTEGTANLLGDDWDPRGFEIWRNNAACWEEFEPVEPTWSWADGLAEMVNALREDRQPLHNLEHDLHLLEVIEACERAAMEKRVVAVQSTFLALDLHLEEKQDRHHLHDHTRPADEQ